MPPLQCVGDWDLPDIDIVIIGSGSLPPKARSHGALASSGVQFLLLSDGRDNPVLHGWRSPESVLLRPYPDEAFAAAMDQIAIRALEQSGVGSSS